MTKKHFVALAQALHSVNPSLSPDRVSDSEYAATKLVWLACVWAVVEVCEAQNKHFDAERFVNYCETGRQTK